MITWNLSSINKLFTIFYKETKILEANAIVSFFQRTVRKRGPTGTVKVGAAFRETLVKVTELPRAMGFQGKLCIHPEQVAVVNSDFDTLCALLGLF